LRLSAYLSECGRLDWLITSKIALNRTRLWYEDFSFCNEAQQGQVPVYRIEDPKSVELSIWDDLFFEPVVTRVGWIERDGDIFGPVKVPPPPPILPGSVPPIALPAATPPPPANDEAGTYRPVEMPKSPPAPEPPKPANDLLAAFRQRNF
jgi:hypothetical protein